MSRVDRRSNTYRAGIALLVATSITLSVVSSAHADGAAAPQPSVENKDEARRLFEEGAKAFEAGDFAHADTAFERAFAIRATVDTAVNLGITEEKLGKHLEAARHFDFGLRNFLPSETPQNRERLTKLLADAKSHVVTLHITANVPGAHVFVNGHEETQTAGDSFADPGHIVVRATADGYRPAEVSVDKAAGESAAVSLELILPGSSKKAIWPIATGATLTGVGVAVGIALTVVAGSKNSDAETAAKGVSHCTGKETTGACADGSKAVSSYNSFHGGSIAAFSIAGGFAAATIIYLAVPASRPKSTTAFTLVPVAGPFAQGLIVRGVF